MQKLTMCGYSCELCKAYAPNIKKLDQREMLSKMWMKYYELDIKPEDIYCEGCRCERENAKRIDDDCPVRKCVVMNGLEHCGYCDKYPCNTFSEREGLSCQSAKENSEFLQDEYDEFLLAFDNKTRLDDFVKDNLRTNSTGL